MRRTLLKMNGIAALVVIATMVAALACESSEEPKQPLPASAAAPAAPAAAPAEAPAVELPAPQAQQQPAPAAPARAAQQPAAPVGAGVGAAAPSATERQGQDPTQAMADFKYMAPDTGTGRLSLPPVGRPDSDQVQRVSAVGGAGKVRTDTPAGGAPAVARGHLGHRPV